MSTVKQRLLLNQMETVTKYFNLVGLHFTVAVVSPTNVSQLSTRTKNRSYFNFINCSFVRPASNDKYLQRKASRESANSFHCVQAWSSCNDHHWRNC